MATADATTPQDDSGTPNLFANALKLLQPAQTGGAYINPAYATPEQRKRLYDWANELQKPQPIKNGWQGMAAMARALIGGYQAHQADQMEAAVSRQQREGAARTVGTIDSPTPSAQAGVYNPAEGAPPMGGNLAPIGAVQRAPLAPAGPDGAPNDDELAIRTIAAETSGKSPEEAQAIAAVIRNRAAAGNPAWGSTPGDVVLAHNQFEPWNKPGASNDPMNVDLASPRGQQAAAAWQAAKSGADPTGGATHFYAPAAQAALGRPAPSWAQGPGQQIGATAFFAPNGPVAGQGAPQAGPGGMPPPPVRMAQNGLPVSRQDIGDMLGNPNTPDSLRAIIAGRTNPVFNTDVNGNVLPVYQNQQARPPIAALGSKDSVNMGPEGISAPAITTGPLNKPQSTILGQSVGQRSGGQYGLAPPALVDTANALKGNAIQNQGLASQADANQKRFQQTQEAGPELMRAAYPLRQLQAVLETHNGELPLGEGSQNVVSAASVTNMISSLLGRPLTGDESKLTAMELIRKFGAQIATSQAAGVGIPASNLGLATAEHMSPGTALSGPANLHLVDTLVRLNALSQKKAQYEHDYYLSHGRGPNAYDNFTQDWQKEISGPNAVPLTKYGGRKVKMKDGTEAVWLPSTDPSGFSLFPKGSPEFRESMMAEPK